MKYSAEVREFIYENEANRRYYWALNNYNLAKAAVEDYDFAACRRHLTIARKQKNIMNEAIKFRDKARAEMAETPTK